MVSREFDPALYASLHASTALALTRRAAITRSRYLRDPRRRDSPKSVSVAASGAAAAGREGSGGRNSGGGGARKRMTLPVKDGEDAFDDAILHYRKALKAFDEMDAMPGRGVGGRTDTAAVVTAPLLLPVIGCVC